MRLKILITVTLSLVLGYSFFWYYMAGEAEDRLEAWTARQKSQGVNISYRDLEISGFPTRMEFTLKKLKVSRKGRSEPPVFFSSPVLTLIAFPWKINHIVIISNGGSFQIGRSRNNSGLAVAFGKTRSSVFVDMIQRKFRRFSVIFQQVKWTSGRHKKASSAREVRLHLRGPSLSDDLPLTASDMELPLLLKLYLEARDVTVEGLPVNAFGKKADQVVMDIQLHGKNLPVYSPDSLAGWRDGGGTFVIKNLAVKSGKIGIEVNGEGALDQYLKPLGAFSAKVYGIGHIIDILSRHSTFLTPTGKMILQELRKMSKTEDKGPYRGEQALDVAVSLQGGLMFFGPIPVYELAPVVE